jgi:hypothetical protein
VRCRNNQQNRINNRHAATTRKTRSKTDIPQQQTKPDQKQTCRNNEQNQINNRHAGTTNKTRSETDMSQQQTKPDQKQTCRNNEQNQIKKRYAANNKQDQIRNRHTSFTAVYFVNNVILLLANRHAWQLGILAVANCICSSTIPSATLLGMSKNKWPAISASVFPTLRIHPTWPSQTSTCLAG